MIRDRFSTGVRKIGRAAQSGLRRAPSARLSPFSSHTFSRFSTRAVEAEPLR